MADWTNVYLQNQNQMTFMNNFNMNPNNPINQIQFMAVGQNNNQMMADENFNAINQMNSLNNQNYKINLSFNTLQGAKINMFFDCNETIDGVLTKFLKRVNLIDLIGNLQNKIKFLLNAENIDFGDTRRLKDIILPSCSIVNIVVQDTQNLIGA